MKEKRKDFIKTLEDLCYIYKDYLKKNSDSRLEVYINNNMIKMYLNNSNGIVDEFGLAFNHKEKDEYRYISIVLMRILFSNKIIYNKDNMFFDDINDTSLKIVVGDEDVLSRMINMVSFSREIDFYDRIDIGHKIRNRINRNRTVSFLDERVKMTKALLRIRSIK